MTATFDARSARTLGRHQPEIDHELARIGEAREVAQLGDQRRRMTSAMPRIVCSAG
jgi:hypothetical protein